MAEPTTQPKENRYDMLRNRASQQSKAQTQGDTDALKRRFAALGGSASGASIKQEQLARERGNMREQQAVEGINFAEAEDQARQAEADKQRSFISGESALGRAFAAEQQKSGFEFARGERIGTQEFARGERIGTQDFARGERIGSQDFAASENEAGRRLQALGMKDQYDLAIRQQELDAIISKANMAAQGNPMLREWISEINRWMGKTVPISNSKDPSKIGTKVGDSQGSANYADNFTVRQAGG